MTEPRRRAFLVGLTGGIATGKTAVSAMFRADGIPVICADELAAHAVEKGSPALARIRGEFGDKVFTPDGRLDRPALGAIVFGNDEARRRLESIVHPEVERLMYERIRALLGHGADLIVVDVPLLFETGWEERFDVVVTVWAPPEIQERRLMLRDGLTREQAMLRTAAQMPIDEKREHGDEVIDNSGTPKETHRQYEALLDRLRAEASILADIA